MDKRLLDKLKTGVLLLDSELRLLYLNMEAEFLLDISNSKAKGLHLGEILLNAGDELAEIRNAIHDQRSFTKRAAGFTLKPGRTLAVDYTISPLTDNGNIQAILELKSLEHAHRITQEESLQTAHHTTRELVRGLAHEIKNPLGGIRGAAQLLSQEIESSELLDYTQVIIDEADRLRNLVDRLAGTRKPLEITDINVHEVLERVRSLIEADSASAGIEIITDYDPSIPALQGDYDQLIGAMLNLVRNSQQALNAGPADTDTEASTAIDTKDTKTITNTRTKTCPKKIVLQTRITRNATIGNRFHRLAVKITIKDNGPGIPANMVDTIFYPMVSSRAWGSGLGLPIAHGIINQHRGLVECHSQPGATEFSVVLPFVHSCAGN